MNALSPKRVLAAAAVAAALAGTAGAASANPLPDTQALGNTLGATGLTDVAGDSTGSLPLPTGAVANALPVVPAVPGSGLGSL